MIGLAALWIGLAGVIALCVILGSIHPVQAQGESSRRYIILLIDNSASMGDQEALNGLGSGNIHDPQGFRLRVAKFLVHYLHMLEPGEEAFWVAAVRFADVPKVWVPLIPVSRWAAVDFDKFENEYKLMYTDIAEAVAVSYDLYDRALRREALTEAQVDLVLLTDGGLRNAGKSWDAHVKGIDRALDRFPTDTTRLHLFVFGQIDKRDEAAWRERADTFYRFAGPQGQLPGREAQSAAVQAGYETLLDALKLPALSSLGMQSALVTRSLTCTLPISPYRRQVAVTVLPDVPVNVDFQGPDGRTVKPVVTGRRYVFDQPTSGDWQMRLTLKSRAVVSEGLVYYRLSSEPQRGALHLFEIPDVLEVGQFLEVGAELRGLYDATDVAPFSLCASLNGPAFYTHTLKQRSSCAQGNSYTGTMGPLDEVGRYTLTVSATSWLADVEIDPRTRQRSFWIDARPELQLDAGLKVTAAGRVTVSVIHPPAHVTPVLTIIGSRQITSLVPFLVTATGQARVYTADWDLARVFPDGTNGQAIVRAALPPGQTAHGLFYPGQVREHSLSSSVEPAPDLWEELKTWWGKHLWIALLLTAVFVASVVQFVCFWMKNPTEEVEERFNEAMHTDEEVWEKDKARGFDEALETLRISPETVPCVSRVGGHLAKYFAAGNVKDSEIAKIGSNALPCIYRAADGRKNEIAARFIIYGLLEWQMQYAPEEDYKPFKNIVCHPKYSHLVCDYPDIIERVVQDYQNGDPAEVTRIQGIVEISQSVSCFLQWADREVPGQDGRFEKTLEEFNELEKLSEAVLVSLESKGVELDKEEKGYLEAFNSMAKHTKSLIPDRQSLLLVPPSCEVKHTELIDQLRYRDFNPYSRCDLDRALKLVKDGPGCCFYKNILRRILLLIRQVASEEN